MVESDMEYIVFFINKDGDPEEWAASSTDFSDAMHYLSMYAEESEVGLFWQPPPEPVCGAGIPIVAGPKPETD